MHLLLFIFIQVLNQTAASSLEKVSWNDVIQMGEQISKKATVGTAILITLGLRLNVYCVF